LISKGELKLDNILFFDEYKTFIDNLNNATSESDGSLAQISNCFEMFLSDFSKTKMKYIYKNISKWNVDYLNDDNSNLEHIRNVWGEAFALYSCYLELSVYFCDEYLKYINQTGRFQTNKNKEQVFTALRYINGRAIRIANEVLVLLKNGYADGAYARHRTLYELSIYANFIVKYGDNVAKAYIEYNGDLYDWANIVIKKKRISFKDIEEYSDIKQEDIDKWRKEYSLTCKLVRASPQGTFSRLSLKGKMEEILIGPCDSGLEVPAVNTLATLYYINCMYFKWDNDLLPLMWVSVLKELRDKAYDKFEEIENRRFFKKEDETNGK